MNEFLTVLAWIFGILYTGAFLFRLGSVINMILTYNDAHLELIQLQMAMAGQNFGVFKPLVISIICWAWIIVH